MVTKKKKEKKVDDTPNELYQVIKTEIAKQVDKVGNDMDESEKKRIVSALNDILLEGKDPGEAMGFDDNFLESVYNLAYSNYNAGHYKMALDLFSFLQFTEPGSLRNNMGLAASHQKLEQYDAAQANYVIAWNCQPNNPLPLFYCSDCFMKINKPIGAYYILNLASNVCGDQKEYEKLKEKCTQLIEGLEKQLDIEKKTVPASEEKNSVFSQLQQAAKAKAVNK